MKKQITAWILLAAMLTGLLSACGDGAAQEQEAPASKYAYQSKYMNFEVDASYHLQKFERCCISGEYAFFCGSCISGETATVTDSDTGASWQYQPTETAVFRLNLDTLEIIRLDYRQSEPPEGLNGWSHITNMSAGLNGTFWIAERLIVYNEQSGQDDNAEDAVFVILRQYDADGRQLSFLELDGLGDIYPEQVLFDREGTIYLSSYNGGIYILDANGTLLTQLPCSAPRIFQISETEIGVIDMDLNGYSFRRIDAEIKGYGEKTVLCPNASRLYPGFGAYSYLCETASDAIYGYNEVSGEFEKLFAWTDCDVLRSHISDFTIAADGRITAVTCEGSGASKQYGLLYMEPVDPSALPEKQELTLACMYLDTNVRSAVVSFNQSHSDIRIVIKDYSEYNTNEDMTAGLTRLNTEILAGKFPDILCTASLPVDQYAARGFLTDLWPLIDGDTGVDREDLMTHLFDVLSTDGSLYQIAPSFCIWTAFGDAGVIGDRTGWTMDEMLEAMAAMPDSSTAFGSASTKTGVLMTCLKMYFQDFIDWEDQSCSFDSPEFMALLNFANSFPAEFVGDASQTIHDRFASGEQLLMGSYISGFESMQLIAQWVGGNPCYVGYPSSTGSGNAFFLSVSGFAITSACRDVDAAWSFLCTFLTEDYQSNSLSGFPTNRHAFEALTKEAMTKTFGTDPQTGEQVEISRHTYIDGDMTVEIMALSQEDYDTFMRLYESCDSLYIQNDIVYNIIEAEAAPFFDGQKTVEEAAALIQNRVGLYVMEQK